MNWFVVAVALGVVACSSPHGQAPEPPPSGEAPPQVTTTGPLASTVTRSKDAMRVHAVHHRVSVADTPVASWIGLPVTGTLEIDAEVNVPLVDGEPSYDRATGNVRVRCVESCRIGDDVAKYKPEVKNQRMAALVSEGIYFGHLTVDELVAEVELGGGHARLTHWSFGSPDVVLDVTGGLELAPALERSTVAACVHYKATPALAQRDPKTEAVISLVGGVMDDTGRFAIAVSGSAGDSHARAAACP